MNRLSRTRARRIAAIAKLPELLRPKDDAPQTAPRRPSRARCASSLPQLLERHAAAHLAGPAGSRLSFHVVESTGRFEVRLETQFPRE
jgi:hypothetical protein